ncbi:MAG TPA: alpha/beta hydrolase [Dehalococcoidia bacterium]|nr:alpha/beta hydrolase [Dehalococcoidia bacterium]
MLHGGLSDSREWRRQLEGLSGVFDVIAWDAPAAGMSSDPDESFSMRDYADCLCALLEALGVGPAHVVGNSWGGSLALEFYQRHEAAVASLVLSDTYAGWIGSLGEAAAHERAAACLNEARRPPEASRSGGLSGLFTENAPAELTGEMVAILADTHPAACGIMARTMMTDQRHILPLLRKSALLIWGERDIRSPLDIARQFHAAVPDSKLVVIPDAGHLPHMEQPGAFNAAVREFCSEART